MWVSSNNNWINVRLFGGAKQKTALVVHRIDNRARKRSTQSVEASPAPSLLSSSLSVFSSRLSVSQSFIQLAVHSVSVSISVSVERHACCRAVCWVRAKIVEVLRFVSCLALSAELRYLTNDVSCCCWFWSIVCACVTNQQVEGGMWWGAPKRNWNEIYNLLRCLLSIRKIAIQVQEKPAQRVVCVWYMCVCMCIIAVCVFVCALWWKMKIGNTFKTPQIAAPQKKSQWKWKSLKWQLSFLYQQQIVVNLPLLLL